eukprot:TRINITY_DN13278_c0_g1_i1.p1 TRINITY_DN13278_c0_g1~~TRINITY_DN13278_c0_g1_i1.p1  ORF type:complete len:285 (+),score=66.77 TRINITY_DN13278_c0_g1_i1:73-927(+)
MARCLRGRARQQREKDVDFACLLSRLPSASERDDDEQAASPGYRPRPPLRPYGRQRPQQAKDTGPDRRLFKDLVDGRLRKTMPTLRRPPRTPRETVESLPVRQAKPKPKSADAVPPPRTSFLPQAAPVEQGQGTGLTAWDGRETGAQVKFLLHRAQMALDLGAERVAISSDKIKRAGVPRRPYIKAEFQRLHNPVPLASFWSNRAQILGALEGEAAAPVLEVEELLQDEHEAELNPQSMLTQRRHESFFHLMEDVESSRAEAFKTLSPEISSLPVASTLLPPAW